MTKMELIFTNGLDSAAFQTPQYSAGHTRYENTWDTSKKVKKISIKFHTRNYMSGMQFLDEKDNELVKWEYGDNSSDYTWRTKEIPDLFEIIGIYGD